MKSSADYFIVRKFTANPKKTHNYIGLLFIASVQGNINWIFVNRKQQGVLWARTKTNGGWVFHFTSNNIQYSSPGIPAVHVNTIYKNTRLFTFLVKVWILSMLNFHLIHSHPIIKQTVLMVENSVLKLVCVETISGIKELLWNGVYKKFAMRKSSSVALI